MNFEELNDYEWMLVSSLVSDDPPIRLNRRGRPRAEPRIVANAVLWILTTGESWSRLPARYPSGPTCRRRFDEWHVSGTLIEIVQRLTEVGRSFVYVPEPAVPATPATIDSSSKQAAAVDDTVEDDGLPAVYWKSPEAWQAPASVVDAPLADAIESMTRQLATPSRPPVTQKAAPVVPARTVKPAAVAVPAVLPASRDESPAAARSALWTSDGLQSVQIAEWRGHAINLTVQPVRNRMYRASVEILKDSKRVERSGLIGPRFQDRDSAKQFAYDWARKWIERECRGASAAPSAPSAQGGQRTAGTAVAAAVSNAVTAAVATSVTRAPNTVVARPVLSSATGAPGNVRLAPLQRYTASGALRPGNDSDTASSTAEPQYRPHTRTHAG